MRSFSAREVTQDSQEVSRSDVALEHAVLHIRALADSDQKRSSDRPHRPADRSQAETLVLCQLWTEEIGVDVEEDNAAVGARILVVGLDSRSCGEFGAQSFRGDEGLDGMEIVRTDPDEAELLLVGWEEDADTLFFRRARTKLSVCAADQVMFLPE